MQWQEKIRLFTIQEDQLDTSVLNLNWYQKSWSNTLLHMTRFYKGSDNCNLIITMRKPKRTCAPTISFNKLRLLTFIETQLIIGRSIYLNTYTTHIKANAVYIISNNRYKLSPFSWKDKILGETIQEAFCNWYQISEREAHFSAVFVYPAGTQWK